jgi:zinc transporter
MSTRGLLHAYLLDGKGGGRSLDWAGVEAWKPADGALWINLDYAEASEWLTTRSEIDPLQLAALTDPDPRPRVVAHGTDLLAIVRGINLNEGAAPEDMVSVRAWIGPTRAITLRHRQSHVLHTLAELFDRGAGPRTPGELAVTLVEKIVGLVVTRVDALADRIAECEEAVVAGDPTDLRTVLADQRRRAIALRRFLAPQREALAKLSTTSMHWIDDHLRERIVEAADDMTRTIEELDASRDRAAVTQEELGSRVAEAANQRLYVLSIVTAIFLPIGFVCALLGVNVGGIPFKEDEWAFWALVGALLAGVGLQLWFFRRRGWL